MIPPKCRICGIREHNHHCQGGTPAQRIEERKRHEKLGRAPSPEATAPVIPTIGDDGTPPGPQPPKRVSGRVVREPQVVHAAPPRRWHDDTDSAGEPTEIADYVRKPARFYAPPGQCVFCDRRRAAARTSMRAVRERGEA